MGTATDAVPDIGDALILLAIGIVVVVLAASQIWTGLRRREFYVVGAAVYRESPTENPTAFWSHLLLLAGALGIGGWVAVRSVLALMAS